MIAASPRESWPRRCRAKAINGSRVEAASPTMTTAASRRPDSAANKKSPGLATGASFVEPCSVVVGALAVVGEVEALALLVLRHPQADDHVDNLVEDRRADARPGEGQEHGLALRPHGGRHVVIGDRELARLGDVVRDA